MTSIPCHTCGAAHGPGRRYCLVCGALVGPRTVDIARAIAYRDEASAASSRIATPSAASVDTPVAATRATPAPAVLADGGIWRRPATSILATVALVTGLTAGYLLEGTDGTAQSAPVAAVAPATTTTAPAAAPTTTTSSAPAAAPAATPAPGTTSATTPAAPATVSPAPSVTTASAGGVPAPVSVTSPVSTPAPARTATTPSTAKPARSTPAKDEEEQPAPTTAAAAAGLPKIDHVWVVAVDTPLPASDEGYLGETLLGRATELSGYAPVATDPLAGAADLVAGGAPSATAATVAGQLAKADRPWRVYVPGAADCTTAATSANPFLAFPSIAATPACAEGVADLAALPDDVRSAARTPAFSYVATTPTADPAALDAQLRQIVEPIRAGPAFKKSGLLAIVPTVATPGARTSALLLSPFAAPSTSISTRIGPYALLRTIEDLLGLDRIGHAADDDVRSLGRDVLAPQD